jgi:hypothetical protein
MILKQIEVELLMNMEYLDTDVVIKAILAERTEQFEGKVIRQIMADEKSIMFEVNEKIEWIKLNAIKQAFLIVDRGIMYSA